jgi:UDP-2,3-diacylglucosamine pyrophosphatase LpxH
VKIQIASDLHLEFGHNVHIPNAGADVLVLAGDICLAKAFKNKERNTNNLGYYMFFDEVCANFKDVIYIMGNHEHYKGTFNKTASILRDALSEYKNLHFLDKKSIIIDGVKFVGCSLWTEVDIENPLTINKLRFAMNDFNLIKYCVNKDRYRKFTPEDAYIEHVLSRMYLEKEITEPCVVVTHHAPSWKSIHERFADDKELNTLYASDLEYMMTDNVKLWIHGHTHNAFDYKIGGTRVVCNPFGYPNERSLVDPVLIAEI